VLNCGPSYYPGFFQRCQPCPANCGSCINGQECYLCATNYTNIQGVCYFNNCPAPKLALGNQCTDSCPEGTYNLARICVRRCPAGEYFYDELCYQTCPNNQHTLYACITPAGSNEL
jgi:hypothetical protein